MGWASECGEGRGVGALAIVEKVKLGCRVRVEESAPKDNLNSVRIAHASSLSAQFTVFRVLALCIQAQMPSATELVRTHRPDFPRSGTAAPCPSPLHHLTQYLHARTPTSTSSRPAPIQAPSER